MENDNNTNDTQKKYINGKRITYKPAEAAEKIGIPTSTLRNMTVKLEGLIDPIHKTQGGHRIYSEHNITQLKEIRKIMQEKNYTLENMIEYLSEPDAIKEIIPEEIDENIYMNILARVVENKLNDYLKEDLIKLNSNVNSSTEKIEQLQKQIVELSTEQKKTIEILEGQINNVREGNENLLKERDEAYEKLKEKDIEIEVLKARLEEKSRKKFSLFGIGRREE